jgi:hypothetical protein
MMACGLIQKLHPARQAGDDETAAIAVALAVPEEQETGGDHQRQRRVGHQASGVVCVQRQQRQQQRAEDGCPQAEQLAAEMKHQCDLAQRAEQRIGVGDHLVATEEEGHRGQRQVHAVAVAADVARDLPVAVEQPVGVGDVGHLVGTEEAGVEGQPDCQGDRQQAGEGEPVRSGRCARAVGGSGRHRVGGAHRSPALRSCSFIV